MKYIILSFDDGRKDNYDYAYKLMLKYGIKASMHIPTSFIDENEQNHLSLEKVQEMSKAGFDFSSHGHKHINEKHDLAQSLTCLKDWKLIDSDNIVFSSPESEIYKKNLPLYKKMLDSNDVKHVRTGTQIRREGFFYTLFYLCQKIFQSRRLFYLLNKSNLHKINEPNYLIKSVAIKYDNSVRQLEYFINKMQDGNVAVFLFHSIIPEKEMKNKDVWSFSAEKFEVFLQLIAKKKIIEILTIKEYIKRN